MAELPDVDLTPAERQAVVDSMLKIIRYLEDIKRPRAEKRLTDARRSLELVQCKIAACRLMIEAAHEVGGDESAEH